tara:strand:+ start:102905 stop:103891 length:987 start_codon:yes stop_codon:yes gene_type:complete
MTDTKINRSLESASVSVVIPCFNASRFLSETIQSALDQTHSPLEVIVVDDGSTDNSATIADSFGPSVRVIRQSNQGESVARNRGIDEARGDWIAFLDADDLWLPQKLEKQLAAIDSPEVIAVHTNLEFFDQARYITEIESIPAAVRYRVESVAIESPFYSPSAWIVRRQLSLRFPTWTQAAEDLIYTIGLVQLGEIRLVTEPLTRHRRHVDCQSLSTRNIWPARHESIRRFLREHAPDLSEETKADILQGWDRRLVSIAEHAWRTRDWDTVNAIREHLSAISRDIGSIDHDDRSVGHFLSRRPYPPWVYRWTDPIKRLLRPVVSWLRK